MTASVAVKHLCQELETALEQADQVAQKEMLHLLQLKEKGGIPMTTTLLTDNAETRNMPYLQTSDMEGSVLVETSKTQTDAIEDAATEAEELYRQQALDYSRGHFASSVREDEVEHGRKDHGSTLFTSLLKAAAGTDDKSLLLNSNEVAAAPVDADMSDAHGELGQGEADDNDKSNGSGGIVESPAIEKPYYPSKSEDCDDEEETTTLLSPEFSTVQESNFATSSAKVRSADAAGPAIDDLSLAVKKKKKEKGKSKRKK
jgi:hypothetical protein